jgi:dTDP-4-amino-4,6-dideoxygalactose transaminase
LKNVDREEVRRKLTEKGVPSAIYYPIPLHLQKAYRDERYKQGAFPVTEELCKSVLSLPIHTEFESEQLKYIAETFKEIVG